MDIFVGIAVFWVVRFFLLGVAVVFAVTLDEFLSKTGPPQKRAPMENIGRIGTETRQAMDCASESFLTQVEHLLNAQSERR